MTEKKNQEIDYHPPKLDIIDADEIMEKFGPVISCSGFGGATSGCT